MKLHSLHVLEFDRVRAVLAERATFAGGERLARALTPDTEPARIAERLACVSEVRRILTDSDLPIHGLSDLGSVLDRAEPAGAVLPGADLAPIAKTLHIVRKLAAYLHERRESLPKLNGRAVVLQGLGELRGEIERCVDPAGEIRDAASPALRRVRKEQATVRDRILERLNRTVRGLVATGVEPTVTLRNDRYVMGVRRDRMKELDGVVHGQSGSGASVYLEPSAVVPLNNELAQLRSAEQEEIRRILTDLTAGVRERLPELRENEACLAELDLFYAAGRLSRELDGVPALPAPDGGIVIRGGRHPLLEVANRDTGRVTVPLDLSLGGPVPRVLVITGPNTGGKTVALKTVGLFALMNQAGLHVPAAEETRLPVFTNVFADIGDEQSIEASLSTFSSHMGQAVEVLREADRDSLVLLDELGVGTDPEEGAALGKSLLRELAGVGACTVVTTHYGALKIFAHEAEDMENASLEFDRESLAPTYHFVQGVPGSSEGLAIAQRLGFPERLIEEARSMVGDEKEAVESLLHDLQEKRAQAARERDSLAAERQRAAEDREKLDRRLAGLNQERRRLQKEATQEARRLVDRAKAELSEILAAVRVREGAGKAVDRARTRLGEMGKGLERSLARTAEAEKQPARPARAEEISDGTRVFIPRMGWKGTALGPPAENGKVAVGVGSFRIDLPVSSLEILPAGNERRRQGGAAPVQLERKTDGQALEIDLRGRTVEEAVDEVDRTLDGLVVSGGTWLRVIHGKGTGALRQAIAQQLQEDPRVKSHRLGEPAEGGSGVTIVVLK